MRNVSPSVLVGIATLMATTDIHHPGKHTFNARHPGDVEFFKNDFPHDKITEVRQVDGNTTDCFYGFCDVADISHVGVKSPPTCDFGTKQGAVACYSDAGRSGYVDTKHAKFFYIAWLEKGPIVLQQGHN